MKKHFSINPDGNLRVDIGDTSDPRFQGPLTTDLLRKAWHDIERALDRNMEVAGIATEGDRELEIFVKNSIMVNMSTNLLGQCISFLIHSQSMGHLADHDLTPKDYMEKLLSHLAIVAEILVKGHKIEYEKKLREHASKLTGC